MAAGHAHALFHHGHSRVHAMGPESKVAGAFLLVVAIALTPAGTWWAFGLHALVVATLVRASELPLGFVLRRLAVVLPFLTFAVFVPIIGEGERVAVLGASLSRDGLVAGGTIIAKALLGATVSIVLTGTTEPNRILKGLERLRVPAVLTTIAAFMLRYVQLLADELGRMRTAMVARGHDARWLWQAKPIATGAGALFVRSYERGERVHAAMLARGFDGTMPDLAVATATAADWRLVAATLAASGTFTLLALVS